MSAKEALKTAKAAIDKENYPEAIIQANKALEQSPGSYHALIFLALALEKTGELEKSEETYFKASKTKQDDPLVWQGLIKLYEKQAARKIDEYGRAALSLALLYRDLDDKYKCQSVVDAFVDYARKHGSRWQYQNALRLITPTSPIYDYLEGRIAKPSQTYLRIAEIVEGEEKERVHKLVGERRTRLGAKVDQVTSEAKLEVFSTSELEYFYQQVIDYTDDDDLRHQYEEKMLERAYDCLEALPANRKSERLDQIRNLADGIVIIRQPYELAWRIKLEWQEVETVSAWDSSLIASYIKLFPGDGVAKLLRNYILSGVSPFPPLEEDDTDAPNDDSAQSTPENESNMKGAGIKLKPLSKDDYVLGMIDGLEESPRSLISQRIMAEYYLATEEYSGALECSKAAQAVLRDIEQITGLVLQESIDGVQVIKASALVHWQTPRHHVEARRLFEDTLSRKPKALACLIGIGTILEEEDDFQGAISYFEQALAEQWTVQIALELGWSRALNGELEKGREELLKVLNELDEQRKPDQSLRSKVLYRLGHCEWQMHKDRAARKDRKGPYARFLASLQANANYAPAYTSLGLFYADYGKDKKRARMCFQKAFELSPSEVVAGERLARLFADNGEWDLVELVAQRAIDSGQVKPPPGSRKKGVSWPFTALGVCQINRQAWFDAIVSFQAALRLSPDDYHSWVGLGESYHQCGRYIAATKTLEQANKLGDVLKAEGQDTQSIWYSRFMLAMVKRELGEYETAIDTCQAILEEQPEEHGVSLGLLQTFVDCAKGAISQGRFGYARDLAERALQIGVKLSAATPKLLNLWKAIGDACTLFASIPALADTDVCTLACQVISKSQEKGGYDYLADVDGVEVPEQEGSGGLDNQDALRQLMEAGILASKHAIYLSAHDIHAQAVSYYNLGRAEYHTAVALGELEHSRKKDKKGYLRAAVYAFKRAIELEANNAEFWNAMGVATARLNSKISQHSFIRSLYLNERAVLPWVNLGALYLHNSDHELASHAFTRAQSTDPDAPSAWLGQGILALLQDDTQGALELFEHAYELVDSSSPLASEYYAIYAFDDILKTRDVRAGDLALLQPLFALYQLKRALVSPTGLQHISDMLSERLGNFSESAASLEKLSATLEAQFEESESEEVLARFALVKADLSRAQLAEGSFESAVETAETVIDLSGDMANDELDRGKIRLSAHLSAGLGCHYLKRYDDSIAFFKEAMQESGNDPDVICLLAQVLWAKGGNEERDAARTQLFEVVESHPDHMETVILLTAIALLDKDAEILDAIESDIRKLQVRDGLSDQQKLRVAALIRAVNLNESSNTSENAVISATAAVMLEPFRPAGWIALADASDELEPAELALATGLRSVPPRGTLEAVELSHAFSRSGRIADAQCAIMLVPWQMASWNSLHDGIASVVVK